MKGKKILLVVCGSIAVYKALTLTRLFVKSGAEVRVLMTSAATKFVAPLSFSTLSKHQVHVDMMENDAWNNHVELGLWADVMLFAPLTANTLAKMATGLCDNIVTATYLSAKCPVIVAPAMDLDMWKHGSCRRNLDQIKADGCTIIPVGNGELASGLHGDGRLAEPEDIFQFVESFFAYSEELAGKSFLISAGPTYEDLDPVRYIGNRSSGKMGIAIAEHCYRRGAEVQLVLGPSSVPVNLPASSIIRVRSAKDMYDAVTEKYPQADVLIMAAAVADYTPKIKHDNKFKKSDGNWNIELERTLDIAAACGVLKQKGQLNIGFALETQNELDNAVRKLEKKKFDMIVLNSLRDPGTGFAHDTNKAKLIHLDGSIQDLALMSKKKMAAHIIDAVVAKF